jgi:GH24 family phage-related lysozyme (muramidase)
MIIYESVYPFLNEEFLASEILNEKFDINSIKNVAKKAAILTYMFLMTASNKGYKDLPNKEEVKNSQPLIYLASQNYISKKEVNDEFNKLFGKYFYPWNEIPLNYDILQDPFQLSTSPEGIEFIKEHEKLKLEAYSIGDGMITVGYGHAEPEETSKYKIGDIITENEANNLLMQDIKKAEEGLKRLFTFWDEEGINVMISQHMWDSMISMAYNMGVGGLRSTEFVLSLKDQNYMEAADSILTSGVKKADKFPGLIDRREAEKELFLKNLLPTT